MEGGLGMRLPRLMTVVAVALGAALLGTGCSASSGKKASDQVVHDLQVGIGVPKIGSHDLRVDQAGPVTFVIVDGAKPAVPLAQMQHGLEAAQSWAKLSPQLSGSLNESQLRDVNPFDMRLSTRPGKHYVVITDDKGILADMAARSNLGASGYGGTLYPAGYSISVLRASTPKRYAPKSAGTEMCNAAVQAILSAPTVDRVFANSQRTATRAYTKAQVAGKATILAQEEACNSFGIAAVLAYQKTSYPDYERQTVNGVVQMPGLPKLLTIDEKSYTGLRG
jgi:hypothetical protein